MSEQLRAYAGDLKDKAIRSGKDRLTAAHNARMNFLKGLISTGVSFAVPGGILGLLGKGMGGLSKLKGAAELSKVAKSMSGGGAGSILDLVKGIKAGTGGKFSNFAEMGKLGDTLQNLFNPSKAATKGEGALKMLGKGLFDKTVLDAFIPEKEFINQDLDTQRQLGRQTGWMGPVEEAIGEYSAWMKNSDKNPNIN